MKPYIFFVLFSFLLQISCAQECKGELHEGTATYYRGIPKNKVGNCSLPLQDGEVYYGALNTIDYKNSESCGACIEVTGPKGSTTIKILDRCPVCKQGGIDLTKEAFEKIADIKKGRTSISWKFVPCSNLESKKPIAIHFKESSSKFWTAIQIRNSNYAVSSLSYKTESGNWKDVPKKIYNYFVAKEGISSPMRLKITSALGETIEFNQFETNYKENYNTGKQFDMKVDCY